MGATAMKEAFGAAGFKPADERLMLVAKDAIGQSGQSFERAQKLFTDMVRKDATLLWELFSPTRDDRIAAYLRDVAGRDQGITDTHCGRVPPKPSPGPRKSAIRMVSQVYGSLLDWDTEFGKVGTLTKDQLQTLSVRHAKKSKIFDALAHPMPPGSKPCSDFWTEESAEKLMKRIDNQTQV